MSGPMAIPIGVAACLVAGVFLAAALTVTELLLPAFAGLARLPPQHRSRTTTAVRSSSLARLLLRTAVVVLLRCCGGSLARPANAGRRSSVTVSAAARKTPATRQAATPMGMAMGPLIGTEIHSNRA